MRPPMVPPDPDPEQRVRWVRKTTRRISNEDAPLLERLTNKFLGSDGKYHLSECLLVEHSGPEYHCTCLDYHE